MSKKKMQMVIIKNNSIEEKCEQKICIEEKPQTLLQALQESNISISHVCNGNGTCGKCKVKFVSNDLPITEADRRYLSKEELEQGIRLACKVQVEDMFKINSNDEFVLELIEEMEENIVIESVESNMYKRQKSEKPYCKLDNEQETSGDETGVNVCGEESCFIAIDIGTTTIAMALVDGITGEILDTYTSLNHQRKFGVDVLSRISAANSGRAEELKRLIEEDLWKGICKLNVGNISQLVICGNTTMIHLLMGYSCERLGKYPFISEHLGKIEGTLKEIITLGNSKQEDDIVKKCKYELYEKNKNVPITILPGISTFVGGDIMAGILACPGFETDELSLLIDLGTNGEMVLGNKERMLTASTAAGPAFEGGNIVCGMASIPGSICQVKIQNQRAVLRTIQNELPPKGICGTGLISIVAELLKNNLVDEYGLLKVPYQKAGYPLWTFENGGKIAIYQQDIREFQMAKSAIRAGISILIKEYGCTVEEIGHVYLAGGLGTNLFVEEAIITGILPEEFRGKIEFVGNAALKGTVLAGCEKTKTDTKEYLEKSNKYRIDKIEYLEKSNTHRRDKIMSEIVEKIQNISLAENSLFHEKYMEYMNFSVI